ncbi:golgin-45-like [Ornithodoros turicata]|uniref:golgin-45-like n=1 Tax=Ornithodoros turicata TaxID=34597 RepID=UPI003139EB2A
MSQEILHREWTQLQPAPRSAGDGMESLDHQGTIPSRLGATSCHTTANDIGSSFDLPRPTKRREPKFVPYEPYKAAVAPILPTRTLSTAEKKLATKLATLEIPFPLQAEVRKKKGNGDACPVISVVREVPEGMVGKDDGGEDWQGRLGLVEKRVEALQKEKEDVENQLRVQLQVNSELKKLLVASLGEDVQARVQFLSEDKAKLADDISFYSAKLEEGMEELDRLSIQCDVWRTKFLASSLVIDELANWKSRLTHQCEDFQESLQWLTNEHQHLETNVLTTYRILMKLQGTLLSDVHNDNSAKISTGTTSPDNTQPRDLLQIAAATQQMARALYHRVHGGSNLKLPACPHVTKTPAERFACRAEQAFEDLKSSFAASSTIEDTLSSSIMSKKCHINGKPLHDYSVIACCRHCSGHKLEIV